MDMSAEEVKQFWRGYCERRKIAKDIVAKGERKIEEDPEFWADQTMDELLKLVG
jgi:hypothetical protein